MKKRILFLCIFILVFWSSVYPQKQNVNTFIAPSIPFTLKKIPDSLYLGNDGYVVLQLRILRDGTIANFGVVRLILRRGNDTLVKYPTDTIANTTIEQTNYPKNVQQYYPAIKNFVDHIILLPTKYATYYYKKRKRPFLMTMPIVVKNDKVMNGKPRNNIQ